MIKFLDLYKQYTGIKKEIDEAISAVISESAFIRGKFVEQFEQNFARYNNVEYCVGVGNGTDAIEIGIEALGLPIGSEIIVPANSFIASAEAVTRSGHKVVFCDCNSEDFTLSIEDLKSRITKNTSAILAVHLYGHPCNMKDIMSIANSNNLKVIEDCAQAHGAEYEGKKVGTIGDFGAYSFFPGKNLGAYGDAGAIVTYNEAIATKCRMIANHGRTTKFGHEIEGRNSRLDGLQAAILVVKLRHLDSWINARIDIAKHYRKFLTDCPSIILPKTQLWAKHAFHLFVIRAENRDSLKIYLQNENIETGIHYPCSLPKLQAYGYTKQSNLKMFANEVDTELLSLPIGDHLDVNNASEVASCVKDFYDSSSY